MMQLSIVIPALHEGENLALLLPALRASVQAIGVAAEVIIVTQEADARTREAAEQAGARVLIQDRPGYGRALKTGFAAATGEYVLTMDADLSHPAEVVQELWAQRGAAEITIASRYVPGGRATMPAFRRVLSRVLNRVFGRGLSLSVGDFSSGFRLYKAALLRGATFEADDFEILQEILVRAYAEGWHVQEIPFHYQPRRHGRSNARIIRFGLAYLRTFWRLWKLRNSILCSDYDARAHDSPIWLQRFWQRSRHRYVTELIAGEGPVLDVGCGSSRIIGALPPGSLAMDILMRKLRYARRFKRHLVRGSGFNIPVRDESFPCVLCSQVIEHVPKDSGIIEELIRTLAPGGRLVLGTPDYDRWEWVWMERAYGLAAPGGYADEHIAHYTRDELIALFEGRGFKWEATRYILRGELILAFRKLPRPQSASPSPTTTADRHAELATSPR
jgi:glycosyltransferase involved in cell wall biosynthesis